VKLLGKILLAHVLAYTLGFALVSYHNSQCSGWECQEVRCPDGYAVEVPGKGFLPCSEFEAYALNEDERILR